MLYLANSVDGSRAVVGFALTCMVVAVTSWFVIVALFRSLYYNLRGLEAPQYHPWQIWLRRTAFYATIILLLCSAWSFYEPYTHTITSTTITTEKLAKPVRIVQLSDLHSESSTRLEEKIPDIIRKLNPDIILLTGDYINTPEGLPTCRNLFTELAKICPAYGVKGNWEAWWFEDQDMFSGTGVKELDCQSTPVNIKGQEIWLCGAMVDREGGMLPVLKNIPQDKYCIFLHHFPDKWRMANGFADLHLAGDTHGGQVNLPLIGPVVRIKRHDGEFYHDGLQKHGNILLYVNHGIGMEGGNASPPVRFNCPPEITVIDLIPSLNTGRTATK